MTEPLSDEHLRKFAEIARQDRPGTWTPAYGDAAWAIRSLLAEVERLRAELAAMREACSRHEDDIQQTLGRALGCPRYCDDPVNFPGATDADGVCVGDHVAASLAAMAAKRIGQLAAENADLRRERGKLVAALEEQGQASFVAGLRTKAMEE